MRSLIAFLFLILLVDGTFTFEHAYAMQEERVTFYATYGYREGDAWVIPMRVWVSERRNMVEKLIARVALSMGELGSGEIANFRSRIQDFVADSESRAVVSLAFEHDPEHQEFQVEIGPGAFPKTDLNGLIEGVIKIPLGKAQALLSAQGSQDGWLTYRATSKGHSGTGRVRLIEPTGLSVISDIDDTIKVTEIPAGVKVVIRNTFFRDFVPVPEMVMLYQTWKGACFHYISGGPWQMYGPLSDFLLSGGFPAGSFHMKNARKNPLSVQTWEDLRELVTNENLTFEQKLMQISQIMQRFPGRMFILVGDSGEKDPEVYREIKQRFPNQVQEIMIRDVINDQEKNPARLEGMKIIQAPTLNNRATRPDAEEAP